MMFLIFLKRRCVTCYELHELFFGINVYLKFEERYEKLNYPQASLSSISVFNSGKVRKTAGLLRRDVVSSDSEDDQGLSAIPESWMVEFDRYIKTVEAISEDMDIVHWWGVGDHNFVIYITIDFMHL